MRTLWDVAVVGCGPAGSAAALGALAANPAASVLMLDRSTFPRDKCCGDAVLGSAIDLLAEHGVAAGDVLAGYRGVRQLTLRSPGGVTVTRPLPDAMTVIPRRVLDARLLDAARAGGAVWQRHTVRQVRYGDGGVEIDGEFRARVLIGADGAESVVRRAAGGGARRDLAVALRAYAAADHDPTPRLLFDRRPGLAYAWYFPIADGSANVGYGHLLRPGESAHRERLLECLHRLLPALRIEPTTVRAHRLPLSTSRQPLARGRVLLAGDAASLVNPISGEGIYYAITSGFVAGSTAVAGDPDSVAAAYRVAIRRILGRHHRHVGVLAALSGCDFLLEAMLRAAQRNRTVFDDLAALGLAQGVITPNLTTRLGMQAAEDGWRAARSLVCSPGPMSLWNLLGAGSHMPSAPRHERGFSAS